MWLFQDINQPANFWAMEIHKVNGLSVDKNYRCLHYNSAVDIIAIKLKCCMSYYACYFCHEALTDHTTQIWRTEEFDNLAILCGCCQREFMIGQYLSGENKCPYCKTSLNPNCKYHHHLYFEVDL